MPATTPAPSMQKPKTLLNDQLLFQRNAVAVNS